MAGATGAPWAEPKARNVTVTIRVGGAQLLGGCRPPQRARLRRIDDTATRPRGAWETMGSPSYLSSKQLAALHTASAMPEETVQLHTGGEAAADAGSKTHSTGLCLFLYLRDFGPVRIQQAVEDLRAILGFAQAEVSVWQTARASKALTSTRLGRKVYTHRTSAQY